MSLRSILNAAVAVLAVTTLAAAAVILALTRSLHHTTAELETAIEGVRLAEELEVDLLLHDRAYEDGKEIEGRILRRLDAIGRYASPGLESDLVTRAREEVETYLSLGRVPGPSSPEEARISMERAFKVLEALVEINTTQAHAARARTARWDAIAIVVGPAVTLLLLAGFIVVLFWSKEFVRGPLLQIDEAMRRFGLGEKGARAPEAGPRELREMAITFNQMASTLERQNEERLRFVAGVAHELRNPLQPLVAATALVQAGQLLPSEERLRELVSMIGRQARRLDRLVGDLLDTARIEAGRLELSFALHDARGLVAEAVELYREAATDREIVVRLPDAAVPVRCDADRIHQVLGNLLTNAVKYSRHGPIEITLEREGSEALVRVSDQGIGIAAEELPHVFEPFRRGGASKGPDVPGAGLGLSVSRRIVEAHRGLIGVWSRPGEGSRFTVQLPVAEAEGEPGVGTTSSPVGAALPIPDRNETRIP